MHPVGDRATQSVCLRNAARTPPGKQATRQRPAGNVEKLSRNHSLDSPPTTGLLEKYDNLLVPADCIL